MSNIQLPTLLVKTDHAQFTLRCHAASWSDACGGAAGRYAPERPCLVLVSATGPDTAIKAVRASLCLPDIAVELCLVGGSDCHNTNLLKAQHDGKPVSYATAVKKLAPGAVHLVAVARLVGLMPCLDDDRLWAELSGPRYTTPLLRSWVGWLKRSMIEDGKIVLADGYGATAGILAVEPGELDEVVSSGVRSGYLRMQA